MLSTDSPSPLGGFLNAPHGAICARLLPIVMDTNIYALRNRQPDSPALERYQEIAQSLTGNVNAIPADGVAWVLKLCLDMKIRPLGGYGLKSNDLPKLVAHAQKASSMKGNPVVLSAKELFDILERSI